MKSLLDADLPIQQQAQRCRIMIGGRQQKYRALDKRKTWTPLASKRMME
jgi:hypothetical protein